MFRTIFSTRYPLKDDSVKLASSLHAQCATCSINISIPLFILPLVIEEHFPQTLTKLTNCSLEVHAESMANKKLASTWLSIHQEHYY